MAFFPSLFLLCMAASVLAAPAMNVTTTIYQSSLGTATFGSEPRGRGTIGIIFSCTVTLFFCVWTAVHTNIIRDVSNWNRLLYKLTYTAVSLIVPEGVIICAFSQWWEADKIHRAWRDKQALKEKRWLDQFAFWRAETDDDTLGMDGAFFVVMGGFVVDIPELYLPLLTNLEVPPLTDLGHAMEKITPATQASTSSNHATVTLTGAGFMTYMNLGYIHRETFDKRDIVDKGNTSTIAKLVATVQTLWLLVQCISRWASNMPLTLLEIHVVIQVLCAIALYTCWWSKPLDVNNAIKIDLQKISSPAEDTVWSRESFKYDFETPHTPRTSTAISATAFYDLITCMAEPGETSNGLTHFGSRYPTRIMLAEGLLMFIFGALHAAAWNSHFPSNVECWLWRGSTIGMCAFPWAAAFLIWATKYQKDLFSVLLKLRHDEIGFWRALSYSMKEIHDIAKNHADRNHLNFVLHYFLILFCLFLLLCYFFCAAFITVEAYISLRNPPDGSFLTPVWSDYWPHL